MDICINPEICNSLEEAFFKLSEKQEKRKSKKENRGKVISMKSQMCTHLEEMKQRSKVLCINKWRG